MRNILYILCVLVLFLAVFGALVTASMLFSPVAEELDVEDTAQAWASFIGSVVVAALAMAGMRALWRPSRPRIKSKDPAATPWGPCDDDTPDKSGDFPAPVRLTERGRDFVESVGVEVEA